MPLKRFLLRFLRCGPGRDGGPVRVVALVLEEEIKAMHHSNKFIGDAQDNMQVCRHKVNEVLKEYGYKDLMIKRDEKFRYRNDLANRIFEIYEAL